jgi:hypothetical protein
MTKRKKLVKEALKHPEKFTPAEIRYMEMWLDEKKRQKELRNNTALQ